jgi:hypothetical protein
LNQTSRGIYGDALVQITDAREYPVFVVRPHAELFEATMAASRGDEFWKEQFVGISAAIDWHDCGHGAEARLSSGSLRHRGSRGAACR